MKKLLSLLLCTALAIGTFASCGQKPANSTGGGSSQAPQNSQKEEPFTVAMMFIGNPQDDEAKIEAAINELTMRDLNMKLDIIVVPWASAAEQVRLMLSGGEKLDLMLALATQASTYVATQSVYDISKYIDDYGTNIKGYLGDNSKIANINGFVYGVPVNCDWFRQASIMMRKDWFEEAGFKREDIKTFADVEKVYEAVYKNHPEASMLGLTSGQYDNSGWYSTDPLGDGYGVLLNYGEKPEVVNWFESEDYKKMLDLHYSWAQKGWISKDAATTTDRVDSQIRAGKAFSQISLNHPAMEVEASLNIGTDVIVLPLYESYTTTTFSTGLFWTVARNSTQPEKAFQMLDYIYGSSEIENLLTWGIEGEHYVLTDDGHAAFPEGVEKTSAKYNANYAYMLPNQFKSHVWDGQPLDLYKKLEDANNGAKKSVAYGFAYDGTSLTNELGALANVKGQYLDALNTGAVNPDEVLPKFQQALKDAGIDKVIAEKQRQLDEWMKTK